MTTGPEYPVSTLRAGLRPLSPEWHELPGLGMREWLWLDLVGDGAHLTGQPPGSGTTRVRRAVGMERHRRCVRLRAGDGGRLLGARLTQRREDGDEATDVTEVPLESWGADQRVQARERRAPRPDAAPPTMRTVVVSPTPATMTELHFLSLDAPST
ncbi:MAG: hypothetical protein R2731_05110 [Nocardioides sp.]